MSTTIDISNENEASRNHEKQNKLLFVSNVWYSIAKYLEQHEKKVIHSIKVGTALILVSLLYLLDPLFNHVGESSMWAIMTVVLIYDFFAGATLSKGLLRVIGTILGGALGCLVAFLAEDFGKIGYTTVSGMSVFVLGAMATYCRMIPSIKRRWDYGIMIFILTFNLVAVSGVRADKILDVARLRLIAIGMGVAVCIITNLFIFPMWASDELHNLTSSKFNKLACCIEECMEAYFNVDENKRHLSINISGCKSVLQSKSNDESLANFAWWEPWHGKFGFSYPWEKYLKIGEQLRELASIILPLHACITSPLQASTTLQQPIKETCKNVGLSLGLTMRELGESILKMRRGQEKVIKIPELHSFKLELTILSTSELQATENVEALAMASILFLLMEMVDKVKVLAKEVEELGEIAGFESK
ncbi:putative aluminum-activated malate transporter [Helianthus annuus]|uniref:Aluminum-activated malate transporter n=1 Tax=Helianthus annuus TaxID=4232 RepID=A0A251V0I2_HELAN|nr:aluminum-activated malate transporter 14 [Helianthus annuus]KAF5811198.1 putative aluminum-activated malate transporter [Helianthus annuus]KAJ0589976.1 putative aluminum-activated malate transporter [Helianthus annuus]KAJ0758492.1 putative aluminum-activated malate transporter [Helianthus annuus]KAJ0927911.1 putative aluminum-activated malate transporter [Helianthus annuus]